MQGSNLKEWNVNYIRWLHTCIAVRSNLKEWNVNLLGYHNDLQAPGSNLKEWNVNDYKGTLDDGRAVGSNLKEWNKMKMSETDHSKLLSTCLKCLINIINDKIFKMMMLIDSCTYF